MDHNNPLKRKSSSSIEYGRTSHLTARALAGVFSDIRRLGLPNATSRSSVARDRQRLALSQTPHGSGIQSTNAVGVHGNEVSIPFQHPVAFLWAACEHCESFRTFLSEVLDSCDGRLSIIYHSDEIDCGRATADVKTREILAAYWSVREFGPFILSQEDAWFCMLSLRTETVGRIKSGMQQLTSLMLKQLTVPLENGGVVFHVPNGRSLVLTGRLVMVLQDEKAHKTCFGCKGASGTKFCCMCKRYVNIDSSFLPDPSGFCLKGNSFPLDESQLHTDDTVRAVLARLKEVSDSGDARKLTELSQNFGFSYSELSPIVGPDVRLDLISVMGWDWMRCYFLSGVFSNELTALTKALDTHGLGIEQIRGYCQLFVWPKDTQIRSYAFSRRHPPPMIRLAVPLQNM